MFLLIVMHVKICQVILEVAIWQDQHMVVHSMKKVCLMWYLIFSCRGSQWFSHGHIWYYQVSFQFFLQLLIWMIQYWYQLCCWSSSSQGVLQRIWQVKRYYSFFQWFLMKNCYFILLSPWYPPRGGVYLIRDKIVLHIVCIFSNMPCVVV